MRIENIICIVLIVLLFTCCGEKHSNKVVQPRSELENIIECKYLRQYFEYNTNKGILYVDSIEFLYTSLYLYKLSDSSLIFTSFYRNRILLLINPDSIKIFCTKGEEPWGVEYKVYDIFKVSGINAVFKYLKPHINPFYINSNGKGVKVQIGTMKNNKDKIILVDYHNFLGSCRRGFIHRSYNYYKTVKNDLISFKGVKIMNYDYYNNNNLSKDSLVMETFNSP